MNWNVKNIFAKPNFKREFTEDLALTMKLLTFIMKKISVGICLYKKEAGSF